MTKDELARIRDRLGLSLEAMGQRLGGVHKSSVLKWEQGKHPVPGPVAELARRVEREHQAAS